MSISAKMKTNLDGVAVAAESQTVNNFSQQVCV